MKIRIEYTAHLRRAAGTAGEEIELPESSTVSEAIEAALAKHGDEFRAQLLDADGNVHPSLVIAVNDEQVSLESAGELREGDTVVLLAAIAGG